MVVGQSSAPHGKKPPGQIFQAVFRGTIFGDALPPPLLCVSGVEPRSGGGGPCTVA